MHALTEKFSSRLLANAVRLFVATALLAASATAYSQVLRPRRATLKPIAKPQLQKLVLGSSDGWSGEALTATHIRLWKDDVPSPAGHVLAENVIVSSASARLSRPRAIGFRAYPVGKVEGVWPADSIMRQEIYLQLAQPLHEGAPATVVLTVPGDGQIWVSVAHSANAETSIIKMNQLGFVSEDPRKSAYVGAFMGSLGALEFEASYFEIVDAETYQTVWTSGGRGLHESRWSSSFGENVQRLEFGSLTEPGRYRVRIPKVGVSTPFLIDDNAYLVPFRMILRAFFHHRCGHEISPEYSDHPRPACHLHDSEGTVHAGMTDTPLYDGEAVGESHHTHGGWHDAADYGKYIPTAAAAVYELFRVAQLAPDLLIDGFSEIPESGNGIPDLYDELIWELDWMLRMQRADGGVYHKVTGRAWAVEEMPEHDDQVRYLAEVTTHDTARLAAVMALAARHLGPWAPDKADEYEDAAHRAWAFLQAHPSTIPERYSDRDWNGGGEYSDRYGCTDERAWAAVELYALTGDSSYHEAFLGLMPDNIAFHAPPVVVRDWPPLWEDSWRWALWSYVTLPAEYDRDTAIEDELHEAWRFRASSLVSRSTESAYGLSFAPSTNFGFGDSNGVWYGRDLLLADYLEGGHADWVRAGMDNVDYLLGANGPGLAFITGVGKRSVHDIAFDIDHVDGIEEPLPGHPVDGPSSNVFWANNDFESELYPNAYPPLQRYFEIHDVVMNEPVIDEMATTLVPLAILASPHQRARLFGSAQ